MNIRPRFSLSSLFLVLSGSCLTFAMANGSEVAAQDRVTNPPKMPQPAARDGVVSRLIARLMPNSHISGKQLSDENSRRALDLFVESFDPRKLYFLKSDIDDFNRYSTTIDDQVTVGDLSLAYYIYGRFVQRVDQRVATAMELLEGNFDFDRDEQLVIDGDAAKYSLNDAEARDRWRREIKFHLLDLKDEGKEGDEATAQLRKRYRRYATRWKQTTSDDLLEMFLTSVTNSYDPHSTYMSPGTLDDFSIAMRLNLDGIGAELREKEGMTIVSRVITGGAADGHGKLKPDDVIVSVGQGEAGELVDIVEMPLKEVVKLIRGKAGTTVRLGIKPGGDGNVEIYKIVRARVELEDSAAQGEVIEHVMPGTNSTMKLGYINLPSFYMDMESAKREETGYRSSTRDVARILEDFRSQGVAGVVLDLSRNGGGSLTEAISLTGLFIDQGPVVQVKNSDGTEQVYADEDRGTRWNGPLVILTSKFSASASEILAGAIRDYRRGIVVGDPTTHGKGTVQTLMDIGQALFRNNRQNYGALKVTLQQFYLPDGESTQLDGVPADVILPSLTSKMPVSESDLEYALANDRVNPTGHMLYSMAPADVVNRLRVSSQQRVSTNEEFGELLRRVDLYVQQKDQESISIREADFMRRRAELDAQKEEEEEELELDKTDDVVFRDTYYNQEVMNITHEYVDALRAKNLASVD
ncbi:MAG: carboxy terminal-processing peptidase [Planctomycetota bacterium]